jgi:fructokinase
MTVAVLGEALIDLVAGGGGTYRAHLGGSPFNVAVGLARQGAEVIYLSPLSDDAFGDQLHDRLRHEGVKLPLGRRSSRPTSLAVVVVDAAGAATYRLYRDGVADLDITAAEVESQLPDGLAIFHTGSLAITPDRLPSIFSLFGALKRRGVVISVDINIRLRATRDTRAYLAGVMEVIRRADIVKASDEDLQALQLHANPRAAAEMAFRQMRAPGLFVLTEGRGGAVLVSERGLIHRPAYRASRVVDTIGAGDTFQAAFLAALERCDLHNRAPGLGVDQAGLEESLDFACAAAAINVARNGCSPPTAEEVREFVAASRAGDGC